jgi:peptide/nickel transport system substrate-binding protein
MKRSAWRWLAISSILAAALAAGAETRPQYGGTLHVSMHEALASLDPADSGTSDSFAQRNVTPLMFDTLVTLGDSGSAHAALAASWQAAKGNQRWRFRLRGGVNFQDGTPLTAEAAAASLRAANPTWRVVAEGGSVVIERDSPDAEMLSELALPRNAICKRVSGSPPSGTGPFHVVDWQAGKKLTLAANEDYWGGRPFLDSIEIELGKSFRDQLTGLESGKADVIEVAPEQSHRASLDARQVAGSQPIEFVALVFAREPQTSGEKLLREALSLSIDRESIRSVLLQGSGQLAGGLLPNWMSGYEFVFSTSPDLARARRERDQVGSVPRWTLGYDAKDSLDRLLAERVALNARDAGLVLQTTNSTNTDLRLVRIPIASFDPWIALTEIAEATGLPIEKTSGAIDDLYAAEQSLLQTGRVIPLFHLPVDYAISPALKSWAVHRDGTLDLTNAWLGARQP